jgi:hypothetical protein
LEHEGAELADEAGVFGSEDAVGDGGGNFGEEPVNVGAVCGAAGHGFKFADEIRAAKSATGGVEMVVAEAVGGGGGGECAAASIGKVEAAAEGVGVDSRARMSRVGALASHGESIANVNSIDK